MSQGLALQHPLRVLRKNAAQLSLRAQRLWRAYPRETAAFGLLAVAGAAVLGGVAHSTPELAGRRGQPTVAVPAPPPLLIRQLAPDQALQINQGIPLERRAQPGGDAVRLQGRHRGAQARARVPRQRGLLRSRQPGRRRRARGRPGGPQPGPPPRLPGERLRGRLRRLDPGDRLPVHLHLRRLALPPARPRRVAPRLHHRAAGAERRGLRSGRLCHPLSRQLRRALLGADAGQECRRRGAHLLPLGRRLGPSGRLHRPLFGP